MYSWAPRWRGLRLSARLYWANARSKSPAWRYEKPRKVMDVGIVVVAQRRFAQERDRAVPILCRHSLLSGDVVGVRLGRGRCFLRVDSPGRRRERPRALEHERGKGGYGAPHLICARVPGLASVLREQIFFRLADLAPIGVSMPAEGGDLLEIGARLRPIA